jgi:L-asparagine transporter-like permease
MKINFGILGGVGAIGAGLYLLSAQSPNLAGGSSWFEVLAHGIGVYFIGKGIWMIHEALTNQELRDVARKQLEIAALDHSARSQETQAPAASRAPQPSA